MKILTFASLAALAMGCEQIFGTMPQAPAKVDSVEVVDISIGGATLQWSQVDDGAGRPASYLVVVGTPASQWLPGVTDGLSYDGTAIDAPMVVVVDGLQGAAAHTAYVVAYRITDDTVLFSKPSEPVTFTPAALSPALVSDLSVQSVGQTSATIAWSQVDDGTGMPANYLVYSASPTAVWPTDLTQTREVLGSQIGNTATFVASNLLPATAYQFIVAGIRGRAADPNVVVGARSAPVTTTTEPPGTIGSFTPNRPPDVQTVTEVLFSNPSDLTNPGPRGSSAGVIDSSAPQSAPFVAKFIYPIGDSVGFYTGSRRFELPAGTQKVYIAYNWKMSPEFTLHPAYLKIWNYLRYVQSGAGLVVGHDPFGAGGNYTSGSFVISGSPQTTGGPVIMRPNVPGAPVLARGVWYHTEILTVMNSSPTVSDGKMRIWVNGTLSVSFDNVRFSEGTQPLEWRAVSLDPYYGGGVAGHVVRTETNYSVDHVVIATSTSR